MDAAAIRLELIEAHKQAAANVFTNLYRSNNFTDLTLQLGKHTWKVHKLVICTRSPVLLDACKDAQVYTITVADCDPAAVDAMLEYLYTGYSRRPTTGGNPDCCSTLLASSTGLFRLADKYQMLVLTQIAYGTFLGNVANSWESARFRQVIREVYTQCPENFLGNKMREALLGVIRRHKDVLLTSPQYEAFRDIIRGIPALSSEFLGASGLKPTPLKPDTKKQMQDSQQPSLDQLSKSTKDELKQAEKEHAAALRLPRVGNDEIRMRCLDKRCGKTFVAAPTALMFCPYCKTEVRNG